MRLLSSRRSRRPTLHQVSRPAAAGRGLEARLTGNAERLAAILEEPGPVWPLTFLLVRLQMTTAPRPLLGKSDSLLPTKKLFFLSRWGKNLGGESE